ncbi:sensor histidine kinase [Bacillus sp. BGMRC 2118]|nr:sensor histidine kinase [Bacillus sp. BGMRC 2118]
MKKIYQMFLKNTGLNPYVWVVFYILPFYFIFKSHSPFQTAIGITMIVVFFVSYVLSFISRGWLVYFWTSIQIAISLGMSLLYGYIYFSLFLAFFIGNLRNKVAFITLYTIHLLSTIFTINYGFITKNPVFITQLPFVFLSLIAVILLPVSTYNKNKEDKLQGQLEDANKRIEELVKLEERQRIARDLHDTLGQKLSLIGLKSDLARRLVAKDPGRAQVELRDVQQTARIALKEVRELVTEMRGTKLEDEIFRIEQILQVAQINFKLIGNSHLFNTSLIAENVVSMCIKEAVNNVVKHSQASTCIITIEQLETELIVSIEDNGIGIKDIENTRGNGLQGMKERLEFVNGSLDIQSQEGTKLMIKVPNIFKQLDQEVGV